MKQPAKLRISFAKSVITCAGSIEAGADNQTEITTTKIILSKRMYRFIFTQTTAYSTIYWSKLETHSTNWQKKISYEDKSMKDQIQKEFCL